MIPVGVEARAKMSWSASRDVARSVSEALDILRRPGHEVGRDFMLKGGADDLGDISLLSRPEVIRDANAGSVGFELFLPPTDLMSSLRSAGRAHSTYILIPLVTGNLTSGICVQRWETDVLSKGHAANPSLHSLYSVGRYVRCEATGESLVFFRPVSNAENPKRRAAALVYSRFDSPGYRFQVQAITSFDVTMQRICDAHDRGDQAALSRNFTLIQKASHFAVDGCSKCGRVADRACGCDLPAAVPRSPFDFGYANFFHR